MSESKEVQNGAVAQPKQARIRRSPEKIVELILEAERTGNMAEICRREGIVPQLFYRWRSQLKELAIVGFKQKKAGRKSKNAGVASYEVQSLKSELSQIKEALVATTMELSLLKKRNY